MRKNSIPDSHYLISLGKIEYETGTNLQVESQEVVIQSPTNMPVTIPVHWYYEGTYLDRDVIFDVEVKFRTDLIASEGRFKEGTYEVKVFAGREEIGHLKFGNGESLT